MEIITVAQIAEKAKCSRSLVYKRIKELGRFPTQDELKFKNNGRPLKYFIKEK